MYDVVVVGGGLAGCSSAINLAMLGARVLLIERADRPTHKLCGEFLSVGAVSILARLGVRDAVLARGATCIDRILITSTSTAPLKAFLPGTGLGVSRLALDQLLLKRAVDLGIDTLKGTNVTSISGDLNVGFSVLTTNGDYQCRVVIGAHGKTTRPQQLPLGNRRKHISEFVAFKSHYSGNGPDSAVEVHLMKDGYCGINSIENGEVNVCWLIRRSLLKMHGGNRKRVIMEAFPRNLWLKERMAGLTEIPDTLCAIGKINLSHKGNFNADICMVGDSAQMIAPFCGDGMEMALLSGELVARPCWEFLQSGSRRSFMRSYTAIWKKTFASRLLIGRLLHSTVMSSVVSRLAMSVFRYLPKAVTWMVNHTRGVLSSRLIDLKQSALDG
jgi:menaquinone-9 beta-reductase